MLPFQKIKEFITDIGSNFNQDANATNADSKVTADGSFQRGERKRSSWNDLGGIFRLSIKDNDHHGNDAAAVKLKDGTMNGQQQHQQEMYGAQGTGNGASRGQQPPNGVQYQRGRSGTHNGTAGGRRPILSTRNSAPNLSQPSYTVNNNNSLAQNQRANGGHNLKQQQQQQQQHPQQQHPQLQQQQQQQNQKSRRVQHNQQDTYYGVDKSQAKHQQQKPPSNKAQQQSRKGYQTPTQQQQQQSQAAIQTPSRYEQYSHQVPVLLQQGHQQQTPQYHGQQFGSHQSLHGTSTQSLSTQPSSYGTHSPVPQRRHPNDVNGHRSSPRPIPNSGSQSSISQPLRTVIGSAPASYGHSKQSGLDQLSVGDGAGRFVNGTDLSPNQYTFSHPPHSPVQPRHANQGSLYCSTSSINSYTSINSISNNNNNNTSTNYSSQASDNNNNNSISSNSLSHGFTSITTNNDGHALGNGHGPRGAGPADVQQGLLREARGATSGGTQRTTLAEARRESFKESKGPSRMRSISPSPRYPMDGRGGGSDMMPEQPTQQYYDQMIAQINDQIARAVEQGPYSGFGPGDDEENDWC